MKKVYLMLGIVLGSSSAFAQNGISLGQPGFGGNGCPQGTVSATLTDNASTLSVLFDDYIVESGGSTGQRLARKTCNVSIPVRVPQGLSLSVIKVDYRGFNSLPRGASSTFNVEYFFAGSQ